MTRDIIAVLTAQMRESLHGKDLPLYILLSRFWNGTVKWTHRAQIQLLFWASVHFELLEAPISADVLGKVVEATFSHPGCHDPTQVSLLCQDASNTASGGGRLEWNGNNFVFVSFFLAIFSAVQAEYSSTLRELLGILWCLQSTALTTKSFIIFACDNWQSCEAIRKGSRIPAIQLVAQAIFIWCLAHNKTCWPAWLPRTHRVIKEADTRSRLTIPHDDRSPAKVVQAANELAMRLWQAPLSFDQAASHLSAVTVNGSRLPFNAFCHQPGAAGVDMFRQWLSWKQNINYVFPPRPMMGRLITFIPTTQSRVIVALPAPIPVAWWNFAVGPHAPGLMAEVFVSGFRLLAFDFRHRVPYYIP